MEYKIKKYAHMKDGRTIIIESVIEENRKYRGRDITCKKMPEVEIYNSEIISIANEICKDIVVE